MPATSTRRTTTIKTTRTTTNTMQGQVMVTDLVMITAIDTRAV